MSARSQLLIEKIEECKNLLVELAKSNKQEEAKKLEEQIVLYEKELVECFKNNKNLLLD